MVVVNNDPRSSQYRQWDVIHPLRHQSPAGAGAAQIRQRSSGDERAGDLPLQAKHRVRPRGQFTLLWNDPALNIWWPVTNPILSERDQGHKRG